MNTCLRKIDGTKGRREEGMMKCNYIRRSESNQTAGQTEENFAERLARECESERISDSGFQQDEKRGF